MKKLIFVVTSLSFALAVPGCSGSSDSTLAGITATVATTAETFTGTVPVGGLSFSQFTMGQTGTVLITMTAAGPPATIQVGLGVGQPSTSTCALIPGDAVITPASTTPQLQGTLAAGSYCIQVSDVGNQAAPVTYSVTVVHP